MFSFLFFPVLGRWRFHLGPSPIFYPLLNFVYEPEKACSVLNVVLALIGQQPESCVKQVVTALAIVLPEVLPYIKQDMSDWLGRVFFSRLRVSYRQGNYCLHQSLFSSDNESPTLTPEHLVVNVNVSIFQR